MNWSCTAVGDFRPQRKCFSISGSLFLLSVMLLVAQCAARPTDELYDNFDEGDEYTDNVEWHHVKIVDGIMREDHPIIMYKEDFVSEDYVPNKNTTTIETGTKPSGTRKYKDIAHRRRRPAQNHTEKYHALKPEKMYFDVLPPTPIVATESDAGTVSDYKFDPSKIRADLIPLVDKDAETTSNSGESDTPSKQLLSKRPKKYRRRIRRNAESHVVRKRNPYLRHQPAEANDISNYLQQFFDIVRSQNTQQRTQIKHAVPGKLWNGLNLPVGMPTPDPPQMPDGVEDRFGGENETDRVVWGSGSRTTRRPAQRPQTTRRPAPPLFHDSRPENADTSFLTQRPSWNSPPLRTTTSRPQTLPPAVESNSVDNAVVSQCVWAIVNCCSSKSNKVRYACFEQLGCHGAFWDLNPCADSIRENVINFVNDYYD